MDYQIRVADRAFSVSRQLSCRAKSRHLLLSLGEVRKRKKAGDSSPSLDITSTCLRVDDATSEPIGVRKLPQNRIMPRWSEIFDHATKYWIEQSAGMSHIQIERH